ncbi:hypothetical protein JMUB6875_20890 [Nocardia sp. JMUB6875]
MEYPHLVFHRRRGAASSDARYSAYRSVATDPGATAFTRIPRPPYSTANARVRPSMAAFAVL